MTKVAAEFISDQLQGLTCDLTWRNNNEGTSDLGMDRDEQCRITLKLEGKADRTASVSTKVPHFSSGIVERAKRERA